MKALTMFDAKTSKTLMIGNDRRGNVGRAQSEGLKAALVKIGKLQQADRSGDIVLDRILASFTERSAFWKSLE